MLTYYTILFTYVKVMCNARLNAVIQFLQVFYKVVSDHKYSQCINIITIFTVDNFSSPCNKNNCTLV